MTQTGPARPLHELADELEERMIDELERIQPIKSVIYTSGERDPRLGPEASSRADNKKRLCMGPDPRLPRMPERPTLIDFYNLRMKTAHVLQSARLARLKGCSDKVVLACLLHDISNGLFISADHGYWGAQLIEPYVDEEVSWAVRSHQVLRFYPDPAYGYEYPESYRRAFGEDYVPMPHIQRAYEKIREHRWYETSRLITCNDLYAFDPGVTVDVEDFRDLIEAHFRQPEEGLGFDDSPSSHMWRTINMPTRFL